MRIGMALCCAYGSTNALGQRSIQPGIYRLEFDGPYIKDDGPQTPEETFQASHLLVVRIRLLLFYLYLYQRHPHHSIHNHLNLYNWDLLPTNEYIHRPV